MALNRTQRSSRCLGVRPTPGIPHSHNSLSTVARSGSAAQTSSSEEDAYTAQGAGAPFVSATAAPTSGTCTPCDDLGSCGVPSCVGVASRQLLASCTPTPRPCSTDPVPRHVGEPHTYTGVATRKPRASSLHPECNERHEPPRHNLASEAAPSSGEVLNTLP